MDPFLISLGLLAMVLFLTFTFVRYLSANHGLFKELGLVTPPVSLLFGNFGQMMKLGIFQMQSEFYQQFKEHKVYGWFDGRFPLIVIRDLDIIKEIFTKQFQSFSNRRNLIDVEPPLRDILPILKDEQWKRVRSAISPMFSSGRIKKMSLHIERNVQQLVDYLRMKQERNEEVELSDICSRFTLDVIASTAFGLEANTLNDPNNTFAINAQKAVSPSAFLLLIVQLLPELSKVIQHLGLPFFPQKPIEYLVNIIESALVERKEMGKDRKINNFLDIVLEVEESGEIEQGHLTKSEIYAQTIVFIQAGYETSAQALSFTLFLLAVHPEFCQKVEEEIREKLGEESPNYGNVQNLLYLDACIFEAMRIFPPGVFLDRMCTQDITINGVFFPKDIGVMIPVYAIHHDPELWPEPELFKPERFSTGNKETRHPCAFLPFGQGPRICIGMRLALLKLKMVIASVLQNYKLVPCDKTVYPIMLNKMLLHAEDKLWVKLEARK